jgi:hypothetical protein
MPTKRLRYLNLAWIFPCCSRTSKCAGSMDGLKLAHAVRDRWPPIKILVVSGKVRLQPSELPSNSCFVGKPYQTAAMVAELRSLVGSP